MNTGCRVQRSRFYSKKFCRWTLKSLRTDDARLFGSSTLKSAVMTAPPLKAASRLKKNRECNDESRKLHLFCRAATRAESDSQIPANHHDAVYPITAQML